MERKSPGISGGALGSHLHLTPVKAEERRCGRHPSLLASTRRRGRHRSDPMGCSPTTRLLASVSGNKTSHDVFVYQLGEISSQTPSVGGRWILQETRACVIKLRRRTARRVRHSDSIELPFSLFVELPAFHVSGFTYISKGGKGQLKNPSSLTVVPGWLVTLGGLPPPALGKGFETKW